MGYDCREVGGRAKHNCMDAGVRVMQEQLPRKPEPRITFGTVIEIPIN